MVKSVYFPKQEDPLHELLSGVVAFEKTVFGPLSPDMEELDQPKRIREMGEYARYDYKIFEEIKNWSKEYK